jgi:carboxypeptidase Taq
LRDIGGIYTLNDAPFETVMLAINSVSPHFIRIESDELTYVMHIVMRYEFELEMLAGRMTVSELPARWNAKIKEYLGLDVPSDKLGCLQDVHWSSPGVFGYFPTYLLGAMNAAQLWHALTHELGAETVYSQIEQGEFGAIRQWLAEHVHIHGSFYPTADELLKVATGETMNPKYFIQYLTEKYSRLYDLQ